MQTIIRRLAAITFVIASLPALAQTTFTNRFSANAKGDIVFVSNASMTCSTAATAANGSVCASYQNNGVTGGGTNNNFTMTYIDIDSDASTFNSSAAQLNMQAGSSVLWAGLYWAGDSTAASRANVKIKGPNAATYSDLTASQVTGTGTVYQGFVDVTNYVAAQGNGNFTVANIQSNNNAGNVYAGWTIVVAYQNASFPTRNLVVYDGYQRVAGNGGVNVSLSGFLTPPLGPVTTRIGTIAYDGDRGSVESPASSPNLGGLMFGQTASSLSPVFNAQNPQNDYFNSTISRDGANVSTRNPGYTNTFGYDADISQPNTPLPNGATTAVVRVSSTSETIDLGVVTMVTDIFVPNIKDTLTKTVKDVNGGVLLPGDVLEYELSFGNTGQDPAINSFLTDVIPANTTYVPGSIVIVSGANAGAKTDAAGDDQANFDAGNNQIVVRAGVGANATTGGKITPGDPFTVIRFKVKVNAGVVGGTVIENSAKVTFTAQTLGTTITDISDSDATQGGDQPARIVVASPDLTVTKTHTGNFFAGQTGAQYLITVKNEGTAPTNAAFTMTDTLPAGLTATAIGGGANWACTLSPLACTHAGVLAVGASAPVITVTVNVALNSPASVTNTVSVAGGGEGAALTGNNSASDPTTITQGFPVSKAFNPTAVSTTQPSRLSITVVNPSASSALNGLAVTDPLPAGVVVAPVPNVSTSNCGAMVFAPAAGATTLSASAGSIAASATCVIAVDVVAAAAGTYTNTIAIGGVTSTNAGSNSAPATAVLTVASPDLMLTKSASGPFYRSQNTGANFTLTASNVGAGATVGAVTVTDILPTGLTPLSAAGTGWTCTLAGQTVTCSRGDSLASNGVYPPITIAVSVSATAPTSITNTANVSGGGEALANNTNNSAAATVAVLLPPTVSKSFTPSVVNLGGSSSLVITVTNPNTTALQGLALTDTYPANLINAAVPNASTTCAGGTVTATVSAGSVALSGGSVAASASCTITVSVVLSSAAGTGAYLNTIPAGAVTSSNAGANTAPATATLSVSAPDLTVTKTHTGASFYVGQTNAVFTLIASNNGAGGNGSTLGQITLTDTLPAGLTPLSATGAGWGPGVNACSVAAQVVTCVRNDVLAYGASYPAVTVTSKVTAAAAPSVSNTATVAGGAEPAANSNNNSATDTVPVLLNPTVVKSFSVANTSLNTPVTMTVTVSNPNSVEMTGFGLTDAYPAGLQNTATPAASSTCGGAVTAAAAGTSLAVSGATIAANANCTITVSVQASQVGSLTNAVPVGGVTTSNAGSNALPASATLIVASPDLTLTKTHIGNFYQGQSGAQFTLTAKNAGAGDTSGVIVVTDTLPAGLTPTAASGAGWQCTLAGQVVSCQYTGILTPAAAAALTITVNVASDASASVTNNASIAGGSEVPSAQTNNMASDTVTVLANPRISKVFNPVTASANQNVNLLITISNDNAVPLSGLVFTDSLPAGLTASAIASNTCAGTASNTATTVALSAGTVAANGSCVITATVSAAAPGSYANTIPAGALSSAQAGVSTAPAQATLTVAAPNLAITKSHTGNFYQGQTAVTFTLQASNTGAGATDGSPIVVTDTMPAGLTPVSANGAGWVCGFVGQVVTCTSTGTLAANTAASPITVTANVDAGAAASLQNTAKVSGGGEPASSVGADNVSTDPIVVYANPEVSKSFSPTMVSINQTSAMTVKIRNPNPIAITGVQFTDSYPGGLLNAVVLNTQNTCGGTASATSGQASLSLSGGTIAANSDCTITVNVSAGAAGAYTNTVLSNAVNTVEAGKNTAPASAVLNVAGPDLSVTKTHTGNFYKNQVGAQFQITVTNVGIGATAGFVTLTDTLPGTFTATSIAGNGWTCTVSPLQCARSDSLPAGQAYPVITVTVNVSDSAAPTETNRADVTGGGEPAANVNNNTAVDTVTILTNPILAKRFTPVSINANNPSELLITLTNPNKVAITGAALTDNLPAGLTLLAAPTTTCGGTVTATTSAISLSGAAIPANGSCEIKVPATASAAGAYLNTLASGTLTSSNAGSNLAPASATLTVAAPDLVLSKTHSGNFYQGQNNAAYSIVVKNIGAGATNGTPITVSDTLPAGLTFVSAAGTDWVCSSAVLCTYSLATPLAVGASLPAITVTVSVSATAGASIANTASVVGGGEPASNAGNNSVTDNTKILANPTVSKAFSPSAGVINAVTRLTIKINNSNDIAMTAVALTDTYSGTLVNASPSAATSSCGGTVAATAGLNTVSLSGATIPANTVCELSVNVLATSAGNHVNTIASNAVTTGNAGTNPAPTTANYAAASPDLTITKSHTATFYQGQTGASFQLTVTNVGVSPTVSGAQVTETPPAGMTVTGMIGTDWTCSASSCNRTANDGLAAGASYPPITVTVTIASSAPSPLVNQADVTTAGEPAANLGNNATKDAVVVLVNPIVSKTFSPNRIFANDVTRLIITITNPNAVVLNTVGLLDNMLANITIATNPDAISTCGGTVVAAATTTLVQLSSATIAASASCTVSVNVVASVPGDHVNTIAAGGLTSSNAGNNIAPASATLTVLSPDLVIGKSHTGSFFQGQSGVTYTLVASNIGFVPTNGTVVTVTDTFPAGITPMLAGGTGWACGVAVQTVNCTRSDVLSAGAAYPPITVTANVVSTASSAVNTASVAGGGEAPSLAGNNSASDPTTVLTPLGVTKSFSNNPIVAGQTTNLLITMTNSNATAISPVGIVDNMPPQLLVTGVSTISCSGAVTAAINSSLVTVSNAVVPGNGRCIVSVPVTSTSVGAWQNTIATNQVTPNIAIPTSATLTVNAPNLLINKSHTGTFYAGQVDAAFVINVSNVGNAATTGATVTVVDTLPAGLTPKAGTNGNGWGCTVLGQQITCTRTGTAATIGQGAAFPPINIWVDVAVNATGSYTNNATVSGGGEVDTSNNEATDTVFVLRGLSMTKQFSVTSILPNQNAVLTITIINPNALAAQGVVLTDNFPSTPAQMFATGPATTTCAGTVAVAAGNAAVGLTGGALPANSNCTITVPVTASTSGLYANVIPAANLSGTNTGAATIDASDSLTVVAPDWTLSKTATNAPYYPGQTNAQFDITARNIGSAPSLAGQLLTVTDTFPSGLTPTAASGTDWTCTVNTPVVSCTRSDALATGASHPPIVVTATVANTATATMSNTATIAGGGDNNPNNNAATTTFEILKSPQISKAFAPSSAQNVQSVQLTISLTNPNSILLTGASFTDNLPSGLTLTASPSPVTSCGGTVTAVANGTVVSGSGMSIPSAGCFVTVNVQANNPAVYTNVIPVGALTTANGGASQVPAQAVLQVSAPDLIIAKRNSGVFWRGRASGASYVLSVSNIGSAPTSNTVFVTDTLPSGLTPSNPSGVGWTCSVAGQLVSCQRPGTLALNDALAIGANYPDITIPVAVAADAALSIVNTAQVSGGGEAPAVTANNSANDTVTLNANPVVLKKFSPSNISLGQIATLELTVQNPNANVMTGVSFTDAYPAGLVNAPVPNASATCTGSLAAAAGSSAIALTGAEIPANGSCIIKTDVTTIANAAPGAYVNTLAAGSVSSTNAGSNPVGTSATLNVASADLVLTKTHSADFYQRQNPATYILKVSNQGNGNTFGPVTVSDALPAGLSYVSVTGSGWLCSAPPAAMSCSRSDVLLSGQSWPDITLTVAVTGTAVNLINTAQVSGGGESTAAAQNNGATDATTVLANPSIVKSFASASTPINTPVLMKFVISNSNTIAVTGVTLLDILPAGMSFTAATVDSNTCNGTVTLVAAAPQKLTLAGGSVPATGTCTITVYVATNTTTALTNTLPIDALNSSNAGGNPAPSSATLTGFTTDPVAYKAVVLSQDTDASASVSPGDIIDWVLIYANTQAGGVSRSNFQMTDTLPAGVVLAGSPTVTVTGGATSAAVNPAYNGAANAALLATGAVLDAGGIITVRIPVRILANIEGPLNNQAQGTGSGITTPILSSALDTSTPLASLPPNVAAPVGSLPVPQAGVTPPTQVQVTMPSRVGTAKALVSATQVSGTTQRVVYDILVKDFGTQAAPNVQLQDALVLTFPAPVTFSVPTPPVIISGATLALNPAFNGNTDNRLLAGTTALAAGDSTVIRITVLVQLKGTQTEFKNSSFASSMGGGAGFANNGGTIAAPASVGALPQYTPAVGTASYDISNNAPVAATPTQLATAADPSGNGKPTDSGEDVPTPVRLSVAAALRGTVWLDTTPNRQRDGNENGVANFGVEIIDTISNTAVPCVPNVNTTIGCITMPDGRSLFATNAMGNYEALGLPTGNYQVRFRDGANNVIYGTPLNGSNNAQSSVAASRDALLVTLTPGDAVLEQNLPLDPSGVVYNSNPNARTPIAGATVVFCGPVGFNPATHLVGGASYGVVAGQPNCASMVVGSNGFYQYLLQPTAPSGRYTLSASAPNYFGPSVAIPAQTGVPALPPAPGFFAVQPQLTAPTASQATTYYLVLNLSAGVQDVVNNHIPLDPLNNARLFVTKTANQRSAELGDSIEYTITVSSPDTTLQGVTVSDRLPTGFRLIPGTVRLNGVSVSDPQGTPGPQLNFAIGTVTQALALKLTYRVRIAVGAQAGDGINRANAKATGGASSNIAQALVKVTGGVFTQEACVVGKVFVDCNGDAIQNNPDDARLQGKVEPGVPGVRIYFENGAFAITDREGKYSFCGLSPSTHVAKVDARTLPKGSVMVPFSNRNVLNGDSVLLDLRSGELHRADFIEGSCTPAILNEVEKRKGLAPPLGQSQSDTNAPNTAQGVKP